MNHDPRETEYYNKGESDLSDSTEDTLEQGDFVPQNSIADEPGEELATLRIEPGLARGFDDIEQGRFEEVSDASTSVRIARFQDRNPRVARR